MTNITNLPATAPTRQPAPLVAFNEMKELAAAIAKSGMFGMKTADQALVLMAISQAEGRHPALAARDYDVIDGKPSKKAEAMMRDFLDAGGRVEWHALTDTVADATFSHPTGGAARISWDTKRVEMAGLAGKANHKRYPRQMLRSRCVSEGVRTVYPMATSGLYVPEEVRDFVDVTPPRPPANPATDLDAFAAEPLEPDYDGQGRMVAAKGTAALRIWWQSLGGPLQRQLKDTLPEYKAIADAADKTQAAAEPFDLTPPPERDPAFWTGAVLGLGPAADGREFRALMHHRLREARTAREVEALRNDNPQIDQLPRTDKESVLDMMMDREVELRGAEASA